jgi:glutathione peroxidase
MSRILLILFSLCWVAPVLAANSLFEHSATDIDGSQLPLKEFDGKVVMVVNTASRCGFTPQYKALESVYRKYRDQGFVVLGFPSNDFRQELASNEEIKEFCEGYRISFPLFASGSVRGPQKQPVFDYLVNSGSYPALRGEVRWNFEKFLVNRAGEVVSRYRSTMPPDHPQVTSEIEKLL